LIVSLENQFIIKLVKNGLHLQGYLKKQTLLNN